MKNLFKTKGKRGGQVFLPDRAALKKLTSAKPGGHPLSEFGQATAGVGSPNKRIFELGKKATKIGK